MSTPPVGAVRTMIRCSDGSLKVPVFSNNPFQIINGVGLGPGEVYEMQVYYRGKWVNSRNLSYKVQMQIIKERNDSSNGG